ESADTVRLVLEPKARTVEPALLMESLFRASQLEIRFGLNMNVLDANRTPRVMPLRDVVRAWLDHRLEVLDGYLAVYLNLDEVIRIIREEDEPKPALMKRFALTDVQAEAILNMRLRSLRRLEEIEIRREHKALSKERKDITALLKDDGLRWKRIAEEVGEIRKKFGDGPLGTRRTLLAGAPAGADIKPEALIEREPITVVLSEKGWLRALKGHVAPDAEVKFKEGDRLKFLVPCQTTDKLCLFGTN